MKSVWTENQDEKLLEHVNHYIKFNITFDWAYIASKFPNRTSRQCRDRYNTVLHPKFKKGKLTESEIEFIRENTDKGWKFISSKLNRNYSIIKKVMKKKNYSNISSDQRDEKITLPLPHSFEKHSFIIGFDLLNKELSFTKNQLLQLQRNQIEKDYELSSINNRLLEMKQILNQKDTEIAIMKKLPIKSEIDHYKDLLRKEKIKSASLEILLNQYHTDPFNSINLLE
jgi:hypothetical protein